MPNILFIGELAALATSACWAATGIFFTLAGRRVGSQVVNLMRLLLALATMLLLHRLTMGEWLPLAASADHWGWLSISGVLGLAIGDAALFQAMLFIGPRRTTLLMALVPIISAMLAWIFLGETLRILDTVAVLLTLAGVAWVVMERDRNGPAQHTRNSRWGMALGIVAAAGQSLGLLTSRLGLTGDFPIISANLIRILAGGLALWALSFFTGQAQRTLRSLHADRQAVFNIVAGTFVGPVLGVMLSLLAVQKAALGIASTLMSLTPIMILPMVHVVFREKISRRALGGTVLALAGVAIIFLV